METGHIEITDNKVNFVYHELPKPTKDREKFAIITGIGLMRKYEASKRTVEVSNVYFHRHLKRWLFKEHVSHKIVARNNTPCKAEVANNKATIIELINN